MKRQQTNLSIKLARFDPLLGRQSAEGWLYSAYGYVRFAPLMQALQTFAQPQSELQDRPHRAMCERSQELTVSATALLVAGRLLLASSKALLGNASPQAQATPPPEG